MGCERVIVYMDKTVVKISGLKIDRINLPELEKKLTGVLGRLVRVIGVSGDGLEFDAYEISPQQIYKNERNIIEAIANEGIEGAEVAKLVKAEQVPEIAYDELVSLTADDRGCPAEKWLKWKAEKKPSAK